MAKKGLNTELDQLKRTGTLKQQKECKQLGLRIRWPTVEPDGEQNPEGEEVNLIEGAVALESIAPQF